MSVTQLPDELIGTGATYRQVDFWVRRGWVHAQQDHPGSGNRRVWAPAEVEIVRLMAELVKAGITPAAAAYAARHEGRLPTGQWRVEVAA